jgi:hypothetical protein
MGRLALTPAVVTVLLLSTMGAAPPAQGPDPFEQMRALRLINPVRAPDVVFHTLEGRPARLSEFLGRPVLLTFFTTW